MLNTTLNHVEIYVENFPLITQLPSQKPAELAHLTTTPSSTPKISQHTHSLNTATPSLIHSPLSSGFNQLFHTIHSTNKNNNFIIRRMKCTS